jgi:CheY-like chemotaxis protein
MKPEQPWTVLVVDDDADMVAITEMVFDELTFEGRPLRVLTARSGAEARACFQAEPDIAVAYIDVVMETEHAGLDLVRYIREELGNRRTRLILRTGNPGAAPREDIVRHFEIDDYREKTEVTAERLETSLLTSLRTYRMLSEG